MTCAVPTASRLLVALSARSLAAVEERVTLPQFRMLVVLSTRGATKLVALADLLQVAPSTAMRMVDRLIAAGPADRHLNPDNRRETLLQLTEEGRRTVEDVTARRRTEIAAIVERLTPVQRLALRRLSPPSTKPGRALGSSARRRGAAPAGLGGGPPDGPRRLTRVMSSSDVGCQHPPRVLHGARESSCVWSRCLIPAAQAAWGIPTRAV